MPLDTLLGKPPRMTRDVRRLPGASDDFDGSGVDLRDAAFRLLRLPTIADKTFLVAIGDRSVGGMISRDPFVGPWQVPVSDVAVTVSDYFSSRGEAMAMGERTPLALIDPAAAARMAVAEAVTNIAAADIARIEDIRLSANWMAACGEPGEDADLYDAVRAVGEEFCPALGIAIPVGKDSLSMKTAWQGPDGARKVVAPVSLIVSAFAPVRDVRRTLTPELRTDRGETRLLLVDLGRGRNRLGGSCLAQVYGRVGSQAPDCDDPSLLRAFFAALARLQGRGPRARVPRSLRRRPVRHAVRDGLCRALRHRGASSRRARRAQSRRSSPRSSARSCRSRRPPRARVLAVLREAGLGDCVRIDRPGHGRRTCSPSASTVVRPSRRRAPSFAAPGRRRLSACSRCATTRPARPRNSRAPPTPPTRDCMRGSRSIRPRTSRRRSSAGVRARRSRSCASRA